MNESVVFTQEGPGYAAEDTGTLVGFCGCGNSAYAIVRTTSDTYVRAQLNHIEYVPAEDNNAEAEG